VSSQDEIGAVWEKHHIAVTVYDMSNECRLAAVIVQQRKLLESADELAKWANGVQKRLLDALHAHHYNDVSPMDCPACRKVVNGE
jgi:hypothetical protein